VKPAIVSTLLSTLLPVVFAGLAAGAGCTTMAPAYQRPAAPVPTNLPGGNGDQTAANLPWRQFIREPRLQQVIDQALAGSRDLRRAVLRIESAREFENLCLGDGNGCGLELLADLQIL